MDATPSSALKPGDVGFPYADDSRWRRINRVMRLHGYRSAALIETLHAVQDTFGFLDPDVLRHVARTLAVPLSRAYAVATFYHFFSLKPSGRHTCVVCMGTACYISGAADILHSLQQTLDIEPGQTTADNAISLVTARCLGSCGLAPAVVFDGEIQGKQTSGGVLEKAARWINDDAG